jgi:hypothetical protein
MDVVSCNILISYNFICKCKHQNDIFHIEMLKGRVFVASILVDKIVNHVNSICYKHAT